MTHCFRIGLVVTALLALGRPALAQQTLTWMPNGVSAGGSGTWDTSGNAWTNGTCCVKWSNVVFPPYDAVFEGTIGTVTLGTGITAHNITFNTDGYTVAGNTITLAGTAPGVVAAAATTSTIASRLSGSAGLQKSGAGRVILTGANNYSGGTFITAGTLQLGSGGTTGQLGTGNVVNDGTLDVNRNNALTISNIISGTGSLTQSGTGTTSLTGANTYSGVTTISAGTLQVGAGSTTGTLGTGAVVNDATLTFNRSDALTVGNAISGSGAIRQSGGGVTTLTGANTYAGTTTISAGTLQVGAGGTTGALGAGAVANTGTLTINRSDALTVANVVSGTGRLVQAGSGTTTLTANNTYTGTTTISAGTLEIGSGGTTGSLGTGAVTNNGTLAFNRSDAIAYGGIISGTGALVQAGGGTTTLTGTNTYAGTTTISNGTLQIGNGGTSGQLGSGAVINNAALVFNRSTAHTVANAISGTGTLTKLGAGTTTLTGTNTYSGATSIVAGTLQIGSGGTTGALGTGAVTNAGTLIFNRSNALTVGNAISGAGAVRQAGSGVTTFTGNNTYTGATTIAAGTLQIGNGGTAGSLGTGAVANTGTLTFNRSDAITVDNTISGTGRLIQAGPGTTTLTANNSYTGTTTINAGTLQVGSGGATGTLGTGAVTNSGVLDFNRANAVTYAGVVSGTGTLSQSGAGTTTLSGANTYSGATTIQNGTLQVGAGGTTGQLGTGSVVNNSALILNRSNAHTVANAISGTGTLTKAGGGTTTLTGANTYSGATTILAGTLQVGAGGTTGTLGSGAVVNNSALIVNRSDAITLTNDVSGTGTFRTSGAGTTTLTGSNSYSGTTTIAAGTLQIGGGGAAGSLGTGAVANTGTLTFNRSDAISVGNLISGSGRVIQAGGGTTTLTANNTYTGTTTISAGTLQIGNGGTTGRLGTGAVTNNGVLQVNRSDVFVLANAIGGTGALLQSGTGTTTLTAANSYTGGTNISNGTLQVGNGGTTGQLGTGNVTNNSAVVFNRSNAHTVANEISGTGTLTKLGAGTTTLTGANTYSGATSVLAGTLQIGSGGTTGALGTGAVTNAGTLTFNRSDALTVDNAISGAGAVRQAGSGVTTFSGNNTYTGTTTISAGTLQIGNGGTAGSLGTGAVANSGTLTFNRSDAITVGNTISGSGMLIQAGPGTLTLTANNTYSGGTVIEGGSLNVGSGGTLGSGAVTNNGNLTFNRSDSITVTDAITGRGSLTKTGSGAMSLTGANTYSGTTFIDGGILQVGDGGATGTLGTGAVVNAGVLTFNRGDVLLVSGDISGTGAVNQIGNGQTTLTGTNTYSGGTTILGGSLQVGDGGTTGSIAGDVTNHGALIFNRSNTLAFGGSISGTGAVTKSGSGTVMLTGAHTYSGGTTIQSGTLQLGDGGTGGTITGGVANNGALAFNHAGTTTFSGTVTGTGRLRHLGRGTTVLTAANSYSGGTLIKSGVVQVGAGGVTGSITGDVITGGVLAFNRADHVVFRGDITGTGSVEHRGTGTTVLTGTNTYAGGTVIRSGTLQIGAGGRSGSITGRVLNDGALVFSRADVVTFGGDASGSGTFVQQGAGTIVLTGSNEHTGGTVIASGALQVGDGGTTGRLAGDVIDNGALVFNRSDVVTFDGDISGSGAVIQAGSGSTILTGSNSYTGGTIIRSGTLQVSDELPMQAGLVDGSRPKALAADARHSRALLGDGAVLNDGAIVFARSGSETLTADVSGTGALTQAGTGTLTLVGDKSYTGGTFVKTGAVVLNGSLAGGVSVDAGATFQGVGTIYGSAAFNGTVAPGLPDAPTGSLYVAGDLEFGSESRQVVSVNASGESSRLVAGGAATLAGAAIEVNPGAGTYGRVTFYPVIHADGGLTGSAAAASTNPALESWLTWTPNDLTVMLLNTQASLEPYARSSSGAAAGAALDRLRALTDERLTPVVRELLILEDDALDRALRAIAGEIHGSAGQLAAFDSEAIMDVVREQIDARVVKRRRTWAHLQSAQPAFDREATQKGEAHISQVAVATDWASGRGLLAGIGGGHTTGTLSLQQAADSSQYAATRAFGYAGYGGPRWSAHAGAGVARSGYHIRRRLQFTALMPEAFGGRPAFGGIDREATSTPSEISADVWGQLSTVSRFGKWSVAPAAGFRLARYSRAAWAEQGAGALSLSAPESIARAAHVDLGVRAARALGRFRPNVSFLYRRALGAVSATEIQLSDRAEGGFSISGTNLTGDHLTSRAGLAYALAGDVALSLVYELRQASPQARQSVRFGVEF